MKTRDDSAALLEVRTSPIHGQGVFAARDIPAGTRIGRYGGRRYREHEHPGRADDSEVVYLFGLSDGSFIDGGRGGNATRFINHSCAPNCVAHEVRTGGRLNIEIEALHPIPAGAELYLDYALEVAESDEDTYPCLCGTQACRGTMAGPRPGGEAGPL
jgi:SET domain-containing protein